MLHGYADEVCLVFGKNDGARGAEKYRSQTRSSDEISRFTLFKEPLVTKNPNILYDFFGVCWMILGYLCTTSISSIV